MVLTDLSCYIYMNGGFWHDVLIAIVSLLGVSVKLFMLNLVNTGMDEVDCLLVDIPSQYVIASSTTSFAGVKAEIYFCWVASNAV